MEAWERYMNGSYTFNDLAFILDSIDDEHIQEFIEVAQKEWEKDKNNIQTTPEKKELYRKEFAQFFAEYQNRQEMQKLQTKQIVFGETCGVPLRNRFRRIWYAAAAALLLGLLIPAVKLFIKPEAEQTVQYVELVTGRGEIKTVFLPDQTEVTLNAGSRIKYSPEQSWNYERSVELQGEALFNVTSDPERPFVVKTENMNIKVLGTVFDVKEYADDLFSSVSVVSGKVEVGLANEILMLEQNQQVKMDKATENFEKTTFDAGKYMSWTDGALYFYRTPIREVVNILNRHFPQVDIELADGEYSFLITATYENLLTVELVLKSILVITDLKCKKTGVNKYVLYHEE